MKRKILVLGVILSCLFGLSACSGEAATEDSLNSYRYPKELFDPTSLEQYATYIEDKVFEGWYLNEITPENFDEKQYLGLAMEFDEKNLTIKEVNEDDFNAIKSGYISWYKAVEEVGFNSVETLNDDIKVTDVKYYINDDDVLVVDATIQGTKHSALMQLYINNDFSIRDAGVTVNKTLGEKLTNAGLNTLLGMGMAFAILILISLIICLFPALFGEKKKKVSDKEIATKAMDNTISQIAEQEDLSGDSELVAVIAAAIAAYEGSGSTDGFRVRSIRKVNNNWKKF